MIARAKTIRSRLAASATALLLITGFSWWALYTPGDDLAPFGAIPASVTFVHVSADPGRRWAEIQESPFLPILLSSNDFRTINAVAAFAGAGKGYAAKPSKIGRSVIAYCPPSAPLPEGAWFAAVWLGSRSHLVRWWLTMAKPASTQPLGEYGARPTWVTSEPVNSHGQYLAMAVADGLLLLCLSKDQSAIKYPLATHDRLLPSLRSSTRLPEILNNSPMPEALEQGWLNLTDAMTLQGTQPALRYAFAEIQSARIDLRAQLNTPLPFEAPRRIVAAGDLQAAASTEPALLAMAPVEALNLLASTLPPSHWSYALRVLLQGSLIQNSNAPIFIAATTKSNAGIGKPPLRLPLPAAIIAAQAGQNPENMHAILDSVTKIIDARLGMGLTLEEAKQADASIFCQIQAPSLTNSLLTPGPNDLPAFATQNGLVFFSTSGELLTASLSQATRQPVAAKGQALNTAIPKTPESLWLWADLEQTGKTIEEALALWRLNYIKEGAKSQEIIQTGQIMDIAHALRSMGFLYLRASVNTPGATQSQWQITISH